MSPRATTSARKSQRRIEQQFQANLVKLLDAALTPATVYFAVPNGGYRRKAEAAILIGQGVKAGVADLIIIHNGQAYGLELKAPDGDLDSKQIDMCARFHDAGAPYSVARSIDEALALLRAWNIPTRIKTNDFRFAA